MKKPAVNSDIHILNVHLLGSFKVWAGEKELTGSRARSSLMWKLFRFFLLNRTAPIPTEKLIEVLWPEGECEGPLRALYTLVYRLRGALDKGAGASCDFILFHDDCYAWNGDDYCRLDLDEFYARCESAKTLGDAEAKEALERAVELYSGDLCADSPRELWLLPELNAARKSYCEAAGRLIGIYLSLGDYEAASRLSERALSIDNFDENFHLGLLESLLGLGRHSLALAHYEYYAAMIYNEYGVKPSERFDEIYERMRRASPEAGDDLDAIMRRLDASDAEDSGPIYCDIHTFTKIYHLERRIIERTGQSVFLVRVSYEPLGGVQVGAGELSEITSLLKRVTIFGLRRSDVITQLSGTQLLLLLMNISFENCNEVLRRFESRFFEEHHGARVKISRECRPLHAAPEENW